MSKLKMFWTFLVVSAVGALAWALSLFKQREEQRAKDKVAADFKAKVDAVRAQRAEEKAATDAAVAKVEADVKREQSRDSVDVANDLISDAKAGKS